MPSFPITEVPTQISQVVTREALIQNTGSVTVYLDNESTVSSGAYSLVVAAKTTVNWPANSELWAATATGDTGQLSILYGASGAGVGDITASIVDPVNVQGGGVTLYADEVVVPAATTQSLVIDGPADGVTYFGLLVSTEILLSSTVGAPICLFYTDVYYAGYPNTTHTRQVTLRNADTNEINAMGGIGGTELNEVALPFVAQYPLTLRLTNNNNAAQATVFIRVDAISQAFPFATTLTNPEDQYTFVVRASGVTAGMYISIGSSFTDRVVRLYSETSGLTGVHLRRYNGEDVITNNTIVQPHTQLNGIYKYTTPPIADAFSVTDIPIPGDGNCYALWFNNSHAGAIYFRISEVRR